MTSLTALVIDATFRTVRRDRFTRSTEPVVVADGTWRGDRWDCSWQAREGVRRVTRLVVPDDALGH